MMCIQPKNSSRGAAGSLPSFLLVVALGMGAVASAHAEPEDPAASARDRTVAVLEEIAQAGSGFSLQTWVNDGSLGDIAIGESVEYHFVSERPAHLTVVHVDSHGVVTVLHPNRLGSGGEIVPGVERVFPDPDLGRTVTAEPPVGQEYVLAVATAGRIAPDDLGISLSPEPVAVVEAADAPAVAARLRARFLSFPPRDRASVSLHQRVVGRSDTAEYASVDIVDYFTTRTRAIKRPRLDLHVRFATGSAELDEVARANLDTVAAALQDPRMKDMRFSVGGHTDDVGEDDYNDALSQRRATSVVRYLTEAHTIDGDRLAVRYFGETRPLEPNDSPEGRQANRRVEFELLR